MDSKSVSRKILNVPCGTTEIMAGEFHGNSKSVCRKKIEYSTWYNGDNGGKLRGNSKSVPRKILNVLRGTTEIMAGKFHRKFKPAIGKD